MSLPSFFILPRTNFTEAKFSMGQADQSAIDALDAVRQRGNLPTIQATYFGIPSTDELLDIIWAERAVELSFEVYKHYWDLIRTRKADIYLSNVLQCHGFTSLDLC